MVDAERDDERTRGALRAAQMYYMQDLTMEAIARELHTSRSTVSRLLSHARQSGLVDIQIRSPFDAASHTERDLSARYGVAVHLVPTPPDVSDVDRLERVALTAARILARFIDSNMTLGIAWGSTVSAISRHLAAKDTHNVTVVQMNGAGSYLTTGIDVTSEILRRFGEAYGAKVQHFPVPAFFDDPATKDAVWRERSTRRVLDIQSRMDVALFGLGSPFAEVPSQVYIGGYLDDGDFATLDRDEVVGDVATVFYRVDGSWQDIELNQRATGPAFDELRRVARRVCVIAGEQKLPSLRGALNARLITDLVIDEGSARRLLATP
ncbi:sugar-binding transcriptional regulator [Microbacterium sp. NPDC078428]|uniref:sugar-binding transcriptional regulator n=1 Tax=Microbacterium sp. NPDC078428 TaxID=3364190 RepID=UPI0037C5E3BF